MFRKQALPSQQSIWIATEDLPSTPVNSFYQKLDHALESFGFGDYVRELSEPFYKPETSRGGRPGIDPEVYFKMLMIGYFENLSSERAIAARCSDSLSIREFLHYPISSNTPNHSSLTVIRQRLSSDVYEKVFAVVLRALKKHKLLKGKRLAIDASAMEANAALRSLENRLTGEHYRQYVKRLAESAGVDVSDPAAVSRFDKKRSDRKTSNDDWFNPHDPDAKVSRDKHGATRMLYKPEHIVDLDTGAILDADVRPADEHDTEDLSERFIEAEQRINDALGSDAASVESVTSDKGYYKVSEVLKLQQHGLKTIISDPIENRRLENLTPEEQRAVKSARRSVSAKYGKALLRKRGEKVERSFAHVLDSGGARRTTLRR